MEAILLLANSAEEHNGLVSALGIGWSQCRSPTHDFALVLIIKVPWDQTNRPHQLKMSLVDGDGQPPRMTTGEQGSVELGARMEVGRPPGLPAGTDIDSAQVIGVGAIPLVPGSYQWRLEVNGEVEAVRSFRVLG